MINIKSPEILNKILCFHVFILCILLSNVSDVCARSIDPGSLSEINGLLNNAVLQEKIPGAVLLVSANNKILLKKSYGHAFKYNNGSLLKKTVKMTTGHIFDLASLTKVLATTFGIMILIDDGLISLDDPVSKFLPEFDIPGKQNITPRHLLSHYSGMQQWVPLYYHAENSTESRKYIAGLPLKFKLGEQRKYSDLGFMTLGYLIEQISGMKLDNFLEKRLFGPLKLQNTSFNPAYAGFKIDNIAATSHGNPFENRMVEDDDFGYKCIETGDFKKWRKYTLRGEVNDGNSFHAHQGVAGHAGLFSNAEDVNRLLQLVLNNGIFINKVIIKSETIKQALISSSEDNQGLGWWGSPKLFGLDFKGEKIIGHTGFTGTAVIAIPERKIAIIFLTNRQNIGLNKKGLYSDISDLRRKIGQIILDQLSN
jgi:serine-type D-Ala-D-Ala carboxypeptidase